MTLNLCCFTLSTHIYKRSVIYHNITFLLLKIGFRGCRDSKSFALGEDGLSHDGECRRCITIDGGTGQSYSRALTRL